MAKKDQAMLASKKSCLEVIISEKYFWEFAKLFGKKFPVINDGGFSVSKPLDNYHEELDGWHATVTLTSFQESDFIDFMIEFCRKRDVTWLNPF